MKNRMTEDGFIYFVTDGTAIKIGFTKDVVKRIGQLQVPHASPLKCLGSISALRYHEKMLHGRFRHLRIKGEWFQLHDDIIELLDDFTEEGRLIEMREHIENSRMKRLRIRYRNMMTDDD